ncbi:DUF1878 domain-containing protein [Metabacillus dongyingensis]|uniref:DUF1878 domain-containing protein n=1 Tax=Metabacillus dongyingensis TaxID=2874282 RepID=UPI003B8C24C6
MTVEERLDFLEYRQQLLFENTDYSRLLFEYKVTREQNKEIMDIFDEYLNKIEEGENVTHHSFEQRIYNVVPQQNGNYHFVESLAQDNHKSGSWERVFEVLYGSMKKYESYMSSQR